MRHRSFRSNPTSRKIDLDEALAASPPAVGDALYAAHEALVRLGIPHVVVGGIAVAAHGYPRATRDVDFLVGDEAFEKHGGLVTFAHGVPIHFKQVAIDYLSPLPGAEFLIETARGRQDVLIIPVEHLVQMKLVAGRSKDRTDVVELIKAGMPIRTVAEYLREHAPELLSRLKDCVDDANSEE